MSNILKELEDQIAEYDRAINAIKRNKFARMFPDDGPFRRELYPKHVEWIRAARLHRETMAAGANRSGKTTVAAYQVAAHLTGDYPAWWPGRVFEKPVNCWASGTTNQKTLETVQSELLGVLSRDENTSPHEPNGLGTGMIPGDLIIHIEPHPQVRNSVKGIWVKHKSGGRSYCGFKSYEMGREAFEGTAQHVIWLDEEPPLEIYTECLMRTMTTNGLILVTFTPLKGMSDVVSLFMPDGDVPASQVAV